MGVDTEKFVVLGYPLNIIDNSVFDSDTRAAIKHEMEIPDSWIAKNRKYKGLLRVFCVDYYNDEDSDSNYILGIRLGEGLSNGLDYIEEHKIDSNAKLLSALFKKEPSIHLINQFS